MEIPSPVTDPSARAAAEAAARADLERHRTSAMPDIGAAAVGGNNEFTRFKKAHQDQLEVLITRDPAEHASKLRDHLDEQSRIGREIFAEIKEAGGSTGIEASRRYNAFSTDERGRNGAEVRQFGIPTTFRAKPDGKIDVHRPKRWFSPTDAGRRATFASPSKRERQISSYETSASKPVRLAEIDPETGEKHTIGWAVFLVEEGLLPMSGKGGIWASDKIKHARSGEIFHVKVLVFEGGETEDGGPPDLSEVEPIVLETPFLTPEEGRVIGETASADEKKRKSALDKAFLFEIPEGSEEQLSSISEVLEMARTAREPAEAEEADGPEDPEPPEPSPFDSPEPTPTPFDETWGPTMVPPEPRPPRRPRPGTPTYEPAPIGLPDPDIWEPGAGPFMPPVHGAPSPTPIAPRPRGTVPPPPPATPAS